MKNIMYQIGSISTKLLFYEKKKGEFMIKVIEESNKNLFETAVNELIKEGYRIGDSRCGSKYSAILIKRDEKNNYIKIPTLSDEQIEELKKSGIIGGYEGQIVKVEPLLTKIKTVEEIMKETGSMYVNKRTEEIVAKVNEIVEYLNNIISAFEQM